MTDPISVAVLTSKVISYVAQHTPWLADKVGGAVVSLPVREVWEHIKRKVGASSKGNALIDELDAGSNPAPILQAMYPLLEEALASDKPLAEWLLRATVSNSAEQVTIGDSNKQANVNSSSNVKISIS